MNVIGERSVGINIAPMKYSCLSGIDWYASNYATFNDRIKTSRL